MTHLARLATTAGLLLGLSALAPPASGQPLDLVPQFDDPTAITNSFAPFEEGSVKVFRGRLHGVVTASVVNHTGLTRAFPWNDALVTCRVLEERDFSAGALEEISLNYLAQDVEGNVWMFGEVSLEFADGQPQGVEGDSWLVGGPTQAGDDPAVVEADAPTLYMPADPKPGDAFLLDVVTGTNETLLVLETDARVKVPAGKFVRALKLRELDDGEDGEDGEDGVLGKVKPKPNKQTRWVVPGIGVVKTREHRGRSELLATSLRELTTEADGQP
jgi:hypothetical protein